MTRAGVLLLLFGAGCTKLFGLDYVDPPPGPPPPPTPEVPHIAAGFDSSCFIHDDGSLWCWGRNIEDQLGVASPGYMVTTPTRVGTDTWKSIHASATYTCGTKDDDTLWCWGTIPLGSVAGPDEIDVMPVQVAAPQTFQSVGLGVFSFCAIDDQGALSCRGDNSYGQLGDGTMTAHATLAPITEPGPWLEVSAGYVHACAIKLDGSLWCWGANTSQQLGIPAASPVVTPHQVGDPASTWRSVACGYDYSCAVTADGHLRCWGGGTFGQLGNGMTTAVASPVPVLLQGQDTDGWVTVRAGWNDHVCALRTDRSVWCWGNSEHGESGVDGTYAQSTPNLIPGEWLDIATAYQHGCGIQSDGHAWCFGADGYGQIGDGGTSQPTPVAIAGTWKTIAAGGLHSCAIDTNGAAWCAGQNGNGQLGDSTRTARQMPVMAPGSWSDIDVGEKVTCGLQSTDVYCWGVDSTGQLGIGNTSEPLAPVKLTTVPAASKVRTYSQGCATTPSSGTWCWGTNNVGQVGDGTKTNRLQPTAVAGSVMDFDTGSAHSCLVTSTGAVACWGGGANGALGLGSDSSDHVSPAGVPGLTTNILSITVGYQDTCALDGGSVAHCWGFNSTGELGLGDSAVHNSPVVAPNTWTHIALGRLHGCGIRTDGHLWCWGSNGFGQRGDPNAPGNAPNELMPTKTFLHVSAGELSTCAIDSTNALYCWGMNEDGELMTGDAWRPAPFQVP